jgi:hypothetical protein
VGVGRGDLPCQGEAKMRAVVVFMVALGWWVLWSDIYPYYYHHGYLGHRCMVPAPISYPGNSLPCGWAR